MAARKASELPPKKDLSFLMQGTPRSEVILELGSPTLTDEKEGQKVDYFSFNQGVSKGTKVFRVFFHGVAALFTFSLWDIIGLPMETAFAGRKTKIEVVYDENKNVKQARLFEKKGKKIISIQPDIQKSQEKAEKLKEQSPSPYFGATQHDRQPEPTEAPEAADQPAELSSPVATEIP